MLMELPAAPCSQRLALTSTAMERLSPAGGSSVSRGVSLAEPRTIAILADHVDGPEGLAGSLAAPVEIRTVM